MAKIYNSEIIKRILDDAGIQTSHDDVPQVLASKVVPVLISNPRRSTKIEVGVASDSTSGAIFTTHPTKRTFVVGSLLAVAKSDLADSLFSSIMVTPYGDDTKPISRIRYEPLTAGQFEQVMSFKFPIELEKNSAVTVNHSTATASIDGSATIFYYEVDGA